MPRYRFTPKAVPIKILFPLLDGASLEENGELHTMWAGLLANAASPNAGERVRPGFVPALKGMSADEAALLNWFYDYNHINNYFMAYSVDHKDMADAYARLGFDIENLLTCLEGLEASCMILGHDRPRHKKDGAEYWVVESYSLTDRGKTFVEACRPPAQPK